MGTSMPKTFNYGPQNPNFFMNCGLPTQKLGSLCMVSHCCVVSSLFFYEAIVVTWYRLIVQNSIASLEINEKKFMVPTGWHATPYSMLDSKYVARVFWRSSNRNRFVASIKLRFDAEWFFCGTWLKILCIQLESNLLPTLNDSSWK